jgi:CheY-like chemotaxis protein
MTANAFRGDQEKCLACGMDDYITKPVNIDDIRAFLCAVSAASGPPAPEIASQPGAHS